jgi:hypothetical protein
VASLEKQLNHDIDTNRLSVGMVRFVMIETRYITTYKGNGVVFCRKKMKEEEQIGGGGSAVGYNFNITDIFTNKN